ncbi:hypothetical protein SH449x_004170 [Pirellulaceae bacterium SH449]
MSNSDLLSKIDRDTKDAAAKAKETAGSIGRTSQSAASAVGNMASQVAENLAEDADCLASSAGRGVQRLGEQLSHATPHSGILGNVSQSVAHTISEGGEYLESSKLSGIGKDLTKVIQRNPIPTIVVSIGLGWIVSRMFRK